MSDGIRDAILGVDWEPSKSIKAARALLDEVIDSLNKAFEVRGVCLEARVAGRRRVLFGVDDTIVEIAGTDGYSFGAHLISMNVEGDEIVLNFSDGNGQRRARDPNVAEGLLVEYFKNKKSGALRLRSYMVAAPKRGVR